MAKVAIFHNSSIFYNNDWQTVSYYEGLIKSLTDNGNDVMQFITSGFLTKPWDGDNQAAIINYQEQVLSAVKNFNPDVVISFNNSSIKNLETTVSCPIILWEADTPIYFSDHEGIKNSVDRYHFFAISEYVERDFQTRFGAKSSQVFRVKNATAVESNLHHNKQNISFIGTCFTLPLSLRNIILKNRGAAFELIQNAKGLPENEIINLIKNSVFKDADLKISDLIFYNSHQLRLTTLSALTSLGLCVYGDSSWARTYDFSIDLAMSYNDKLVYSLAHNQDIYNNSKISFNISHAQAITGYPWRILDILASSSVLVTDPKADLIKDMGPNAKLQVYQSPYEAYEICRKLLDNENLRQDIVSSSNEIINKNFRWHHRLAEIEEILGLKLLALQSKGAYTQFKPIEDPIVSNLYNGLIFASHIKENLEKLLNKKKNKRSVSKSFIKKIYVITPNIIKFIVFKFASYKKSSNRKIYEIQK